MLSPPGDKENIFLLSFIVKFEIIPKFIDKYKKYHYSQLTLCAFSWISFLWYSCIFLPLRPLTGSIQQGPTTDHPHSLDNLAHPIHPLSTSPVMSDGDESKDETRLCSH